MCDVALLRLRLSVEKAGNSLRRSSSPVGCSIVSCHNHLVRTGNANVALCGDLRKRHLIRVPFFSFSFPIAIYFKEPKANY